MRREGTRVNKKAIFIDIDGTLIDHKGQIPDSAAQAIKEARKNGHVIFVCTGRSRAEISQAILEMHLDGIIGAAGGYVELEGKSIYEVYIPKQEVAHIVDFFEQHDTKFYLEATSHVYSNSESKTYFMERMHQRIVSSPEAEADIKRQMDPFIKNMKDDTDLIREDINKVTFMGASLSLEEIQDEFKEHFVVIPGSYGQKGKICGELMLKEVHKATGIEIVLKALGIAQKDTFGYGDSYNDIEMLQYVACGVAMVNGAEALKQVADDLTDAPEEDGLYKSFKKYGLI